jgi:hypothetical protein
MTWGQLRGERPDLADAGRGLFYQFGVGLAFMATVRKDGGPRVHPMCPVITDDVLFAFIVPSPKREDLLRDGRYAMHAFPADDNEDAFSVTGIAEPRTDPRLRDAIAAIYLKERDLSVPPPGFAEQLLFEFLIDGCLLTRTTGHGDPAPVHTVWKADVGRNQLN